MKHKPEVINARKPTEVELTEAMSREPVYKVVKVDCRVLRSLWVIGTVSNPKLITVNSKQVEASALTYMRGRLTTGGRFGVWCCKSLAAAYRQVTRNGMGKRCLIFEAYPLGKRIRNITHFGTQGTILYPAIILGSRIIAKADERGNITKCNLS